VQVATITSNDLGAFSTTFTIPADTTSGTHTLEVTRTNSSTVLASTPVTIQAAPVSTAQPTKLPLTGADVGDLVRAAMFLISIGVGLVVAGRRTAEDPARNGSE
jgi:hypothetical protein